MGPSRAQASWKPSAWHSRVELERGCPSGRIRTHCFASQEALENRFAELKDQDDWAASKPHWRELRRAQECWARGVEGARRGALTPVAVAIDIETWEEDHDTITEVGIASVAVRPDGSFEEKTEHYGASSFSEPLPLPPSRSHSLTPPCTRSRRRKRSPPQRSLLSRSPRLFPVRHLRRPPLSRDLLPPPRAPLRIFPFLILLFCATASTSTRRALLFLRPLLPYCTTRTSLRPATAATAPRPPLPPPARRPLRRQVPLAA